MSSGNPPNQTFTGLFGYQGPQANNQIGDNNYPDYDIDFSNQPDNNFDNQIISENFDQDTSQQQQYQQNTMNKQNSEDEFENEPPILEELDIDLESIKSKFISIAKLWKFDDEISKNPDMLGPF